MEKRVWIRTVSFLFLVVQYEDGMEVVTEMQNENHDNLTTQSELTKEEQLTNISLEMSSPEPKGITLRMTAALDDISFAANAT